MRRLRGFTLIEVLVALAIVAFGLAALLSVTTQTARACEPVCREKTFAQWITLDITEARLTGQQPSDDKAEGETKFKSQDFGAGSSRRSRRRSTASCGSRRVRVSTRELRRRLGRASQSVSWAIRLRNGTAAPNWLVSLVEAGNPAPEPDPRQAQRPARLPGEAPRPGNTAGQDHAE